MKISDNLINSFKKMDVDGVALLERNIDKLSKQYKITEVSAIEYMNAVKSGSIQLKDGQTMLSGYQSYLRSTSKSLDLTNIKTKALSASMKVFSTIGWMAIMWGVSALIGEIGKLITANERAIEDAGELRNQYAEFKETNASNVSTLKDLDEEFKELSKGVSQYGDNISLTSNEYDRYREIIQQIVGMSPALSEGYNIENGYIANKNGLIERAIELQEKEYQNELRKITNLDSLKTSMSGYVAEYKKAFNGGFVTDDGSATATQEFTKMQNSIYKLFNTNNRSNFSTEDMVKQIMSSLGIEDVEKEISKYYNKYGYFQSNDFWNDYADTIAGNVQIIGDSL